MSPPSEHPIPRPEHDALRDALGRARGGVLVLGPAGVGKTTLLARVLAEVAGPGAVRRLAPDPPAGARPAPPDRPAPVVTDLGHDHDEHDDDLDALWWCDDVDLLDGAAAARLAARCRRGGRAALSARSAARLGAPIAQLWQERTIEVVRLDPLPLDALEDHLARLLGGPIDHRACAELRRVTHGDLRLVHALVADGRRTGDLERRSGIWTWTGALRAGGEVLKVAGLTVDWRICVPAPAHLPLGDAAAGATAHLFAFRVDVRFSYQVGYDTG